MAPAQVVTSSVGDYDYKPNSYNSFGSSAARDKNYTMNPVLGIFNEQPEHEYYQWKNVGPQLESNEIRPHYVRAQNPTGAYSILAVTPVLDDPTKVATGNDRATLTKTSYIDDEKSGIGKLFKRDIGIGFSLTGFYKTGKFNGGLGFQYKMYLAKGIHELNFKPYLAYNFTNGIYLTAFSEAMSLKMMTVKPVTSLVMSSQGVPEIQIAETDNADDTNTSLIVHSGTSKRVDVDNAINSGNIDPSKLSMSSDELENLEDDNKIGLGVKNYINIGRNEYTFDGGERVTASTESNSGVYHTSTIITGSSDSSSDSDSSGDGGISVTRFSMPLGAGVGKVFEVGKSAIDLHLSYYYTLDIDTITFEKTAAPPGDDTENSKFKIYTDIKPPAENKNNQEILSGGHHDIGLSISFLIPK